MEEEIAALDPRRRSDLDQATGAARIVSWLAVAEATLVEMDDGDRQGGGAQTSITWKWSRSASTKSSSSPVIAR